MIFRFTKDMRRQTVSNVFITIPLEDKKYSMQIYSLEKKNMSLQCQMPLSADTSMSIYSLQHPCHTSVHRRIWIYTTRRIHRFPFTFLSLSLPPSLSLNLPSCYPYPPPLYASVSYYHYPPPFCASVHTLYKIISS